MWASVGGTVRTGLHVPVFIGCDSATSTPGFLRRPLVASTLAAVAHLWRDILCEICPLSISSASLPLSSGPYGATACGGTERAELLAEIF